MSKGTILYIGGFELPDKNAAAQRVISNGKLLRELGYFVVYCGMNKDEKCEPNNARKSYFGFESYSLNYPNSTFQWFKYINEFKYYLKIIKKYPDLKAIICYNLPSGSLYRLKKYGNKKRIKIISDCTEWYEAPKEGSILSRNVKRLDIFLRMRRLHFAMDGIISISELLHRYYSANNQKTIKVPPLVDSSDPKWKNELRIERRPVHLVYSGSPFSLTSKSSVKDRLDLIIEALYSLKLEGVSFFMNIVGLQKESFLEVYPEMTDMISGLEDCIIFHGRVPHETSINLLKSSDFSIFVRDENIVTKAGFPTKFVESISCGIPVLTNKNSNIQDYLVEGQNGFWVSTESPGALKESMQVALSQSPESILELKKNCKNALTFDYHNFTEEFEYLLN